MLVYRTVDKRARGEALGSEASMARVLVAEADHAVTDFGLDFMSDTFNGRQFSAHLAHHERAIVTSIAAGAAEIQLGLLHFGEEKDRPKPDIRVARHTIDMLAMIQDKTRGNLNMEEQRLIENSLTELRFRFVQALEASKKEPPPAEPTTNEAPAAE